MRGFILLCLIAAATAEQLGYDYQPGGQDYAVGGGLAGGSIGSSGSGSLGGGSLGGFSSGSLGGASFSGESYSVGSLRGGSLGGGSLVGGSLGAGSLGGGSLGAGSLGGGSLSSGSFSGGSLGGGFVSGGSLGGGSLGGGSLGGLGGASLGGGLTGGVVGGSHGGFGGFAGGNDAGSFAGGSGGAGFGGSGFEVAPITDYRKEFYTYSAPEEEFHDHSGAHQLSSSLKKNLRVVFIKAPENQGLTNAALQLAKQSTEDRTAIYVLNKQADIGDLANRLQSLQSSSAHKPEVHFVKYRTAEDAARAQHAIQNQYNSLGGQSISSNEGVAPVLNFASPGASVGGFVGGASHGGIAASAGGFLGGASHGGIGGSSLTSISNAAYVAPSTSYLPSARRA